MSSGDSSPNTPYGADRPYNDMPSYSDSPKSVGPVSFGSSSPKTGSQPGSQVPSVTGEPASAPSPYGSGPSYGTGASTYETSSPYGSASSYGGGDYSPGNYGSTSTGSNQAPQYTPAAGTTGGPSYADQPYPQPYANPMAQQGTNGLAIASLVTGLVSLFLVPILGLLPVILGHIALKQCNERGQEGKGMAIAGLVTGYLAILACVVFVLFYIILFAGVIASTPSGY